MFADSVGLLLVPNTNYNFIFIYISDVPNERKLSKVDYVIINLRLLLNFLLLVLLIYYFSLPISFHSTLTILLL